MTGKLTKVTNEMAGGRDLSRMAFVSRRSGEYYSVPAQWEVSKEMYEYGLRFDNRNLRVSVTHKYGEFVLGQLHDYGSCCGMAVMAYPVARGARSEQLRMIQAFQYLMSVRERDVTRSIGCSQPLERYLFSKNRLLFTDAVHGENGPKYSSMYMLCKSVPSIQEVGTPVTNRNSGNKITMFIHDIENNSDDGGSY